MRNEDLTSLGSELLAGRLASGRLACSLLGPSHNEADDLHESAMSAWCQELAPLFITLLVADKGSGWGLTF